MRGIFSRKEAADLPRISTETLHQLKLRHVRINRRVLFRHDDLMAYVVSVVVVPSR
jgi:hypothetical protein